jgi:hypothetical protein
MGRWFDTFAAGDDAWTGHAHAVTLSSTKAHVMTRMRAVRAPGDGLPKAGRPKAQRWAYRCLLNRADELDELAAQARQFAAHKALRAGQPAQLTAPESHIRTGLATRAVRRAAVKIATRAMW